MYIEENDVRTPRDRMDESDLTKHLIPGRPFGPRCERMGCAMSVGAPLAMVYAPLQEWRGIYDCEKAICQGTLFAELDKPLEGRGGKYR